MKRAPAEKEPRKSVRERSRPVVVVIMCVDFCRYMEIRGRRNGLGWLEASDKT